MTIFLGFLVLIVAVAGALRFSIWADEWWRSHRVARRHNRKAGRR